MESKGSLSYSQEPFAGPSPEPDGTDPQPSILVKTNFNIIFPSTPRPSKLFSLAFSTKILYEFVFSPFHVTCVAQFDFFHNYWN
jgi:hypothetical protein